ncbi:uncharacterized protein MONOS_10431 [Monocercomonoides exilis]|uniref:uncharacterized protein n=1 Tax=Monocercomonoides exilis TaxID=2049356 RepID=UPI003559CF15|nr:hypothetical protein MONOS_10431 [Monocercomonoides exilis]|eukprot:MONOS_10431.1-p1 / transcript=MONOS_10431.1 / gene=MONOS_10431 / organism=Monocercomonoides_exilis_PA203 / gene_product=unspecified product / transcript_product=unspecified product / location=Mono_scaffold00475:1119-3046(+) / protein_length=464 / sequence_SO=supercontig / SO=protein_coding / is_pseudo=false
MWWTGTALDLKFVGDDNLQRLAQLADTPAAFYQKYVKTKQSELLKQDVQIALNTTPEYASDFATRVIEYFEAHWYPQHASELEPPKPVLPPVPAAISTTPAMSSASQPMTFTPSITLSPSSYSSTLQPSVHQVIQPPQIEQTFTRQEVTAMLEKAKYENQDSTARRCNELRDFAVAQITGLKEEIQQIQNTQKMLADSFNQMRKFLEDYMKTQQTPPGQTGYIIGAPPVAGGHVASAYPGSMGGMYGGPSSSMVPSYPMGMPPATSGLTPYSCEPNLSGAINLLKDSRLESPFSSPSDIFINDMTAFFHTLRESTVLLDYICLENVVIVEWKAMLPQTGAAIGLGFVMDVMGTGCAAEKGQKIFVEYRSNGILQIRGREERVDPFMTGDVIRIELNMINRTACFFRNNMLIPIKISVIPKVIKLYAVGSGPGARVDVKSLSMTSSYSNIPPNAFRCDIAMDKV